MTTSAEIYAFRSQFPELEEASDPDIATALKVAALWVDPALWDEADCAQAKLFWAAHFLSLQQQQLASAQIGGAGASDTFVRSIGIGERRVMFGERGSLAKGESMMGPGDALLNRTVYGMLYLALRARNVPAVAVV